MKDEPVVAGGWMPLVYAGGNSVRVRWSETAVQDLMRTASWRNKTSRDWGELGRWQLLRGWQREESP